MPVTQPAEMMTLLRRSTGIMSEIPSSSQRSTRNNPLPICVQQEKKIVLRKKDNLFLKKSSKDLIGKNK